MNSEKIVKNKEKVVKNEKSGNDPIDDIKWEKLETQEEIDEYYASIREAMNSEEFKPVYTPWE